MKRFFGGFVLFGAAAVLLALGSGCDSPNSPGSSAQPYHQVASYQFPAPAKDVVAVGDLAAVAAGAYGGVLLNVHDLAHIDTVFRATLTSPFEGASKASLDTINHLFSFTADPQVMVGASDPVYDYVTRQYVMDVLTEGPYFSLGALSTHNNISYWGAYCRSTTGGAFHGYRMVRDSDTSAWTTDGNPIFQYYFPNVTWGAINRGQGFVHRSRDGIFALTVLEAGVHFLNDSTGAVLSTILVPGSAYDCQWYQDSLLVVAANLQLVILNAQDAAHPYIISQLAIPNSDRMERVAIDDHWACVMDIYDGIYVVDISNPRNPAYVQLLKMDSPTSVFANGGRVYATDDIAGLEVFSR